MSKFVVLAALFVASPVFADGFVCGTTANDLSIKVYNHTHAALGTRNAAIMIVSNPSAKDGEKTLAKFTDADESLVSHSETYTATFLPTADADRELSGIALGYVKTLTLDVYYNYDQPVPAGTTIGGEITLATAKGTLIRQVECTRYLKSGS